MNFSYPKVNDPNFIEFIYQDKLLSKIVDLSLQLNPNLKPTTDLVKLFTMNGKLNRITRPAVFKEHITRLLDHKSPEYGLMLTAIRLWTIALNHSVLSSTEYPKGIENLKIPVLRRYQLLNYKEKYHFLISHIKLIDLLGRKGTDLFAYLNIHDGREHLYHGKDVEELIFNMFFGFETKLSKSMMKSADIDLVSQLRNCERGLFNSKLFSNITTVSE